MARTIGVIQARMGSRRYPGKMLMELGSYPLIEWVVRRVRCSSMLEEVVLATSMLPENDSLAAVAEQFGIKVFRGDEEDVLSRFVAVADIESADVIVRICADNPFVAPAEIDRIVRFFLASWPDYAFNHIPALRNNYADGLGAEVVSREVLRDIDAKAKEEKYREHPFLYVWNNRIKFLLGTVGAPKALAHPAIRLDVDTPADLKFLESFLRSSPHESVTPELFDVRRIIRKIALLDTAVEGAAA